MVKQTENRKLDSIYRPDIKSDFRSGLIVFLVALPLCLGIALASGAELISGLIAGIVGGTVVALMSGSPLSVSGPAAGLTVIVINAISDLGSFETFLAAVVIAGVLQIIFGLLKAGSIAAYFPSNVIKGMLAAIGLILILKQVPHAMGYDKDYEGDFGFIQLDNENTFTEILKAFAKPDMGALIISAVAALMILLWDRPFMKKVSKLLPAGLVVVITGTLINYIFLQSGSPLAVGGEHLVSIPTGNLRESMKFPDFGTLLNIKVWITAVTLAIVASIESLLSIEAIDKLDPLKRNSDSNRELIAQGAGNTISGLLGGLPLTAVIVRGSANINSGAKSRYSSFIHGVLLLLSVLVLAEVINLIPKAALAILLIFVGYKLCNVQLMKSMFRSNREISIPFFSTLLAILFTDLLIGISIGMCVGVIFILRNMLKNVVSFRTEKVGQNNQSTFRIKLAEQVPFLSKAQVQKLLDKIPDGSRVIIDGSKAKFVDPDVSEIIYDFAAIAPTRNIGIELIEVPKAFQAPGH